MDILISSNLEVLIFVRIIQQILLVELCICVDTLELFSKFIQLVLNLLLVCSCCCLQYTSITSLNYQFTSSLQDSMLLIHSTLSGLNQRNTILCVVRCTVQTANLSSHFLRNSKTCCIVCCTVDSVSTGKFLSRFSQIVSYDS